MAEKDWLTSENARNKAHASLYTAIMHRAFGASAEILIGHHLTFEEGGDLSTEDEIPSADTMMFDHDIMGRVFGANAVAIMRQLASVPVSQRDAVLAHAWEMVELATTSVRAA